MPEPLKVYIASSWRNEEHQQLVALMRAHGFDVYDFRNAETATTWAKMGLPHLWSTSDFLQCLKHPEAERAFQSDDKALRDCDICILALPCGRSAHLEAGLAMGAGKFTLIYLGDKWDGEPELTYKMADGIVVSQNQLVAACRSYRTEVANCG